MVKREPAKLKKVEDLFKGEYKESTGIDTPHRVETDEDTYSRVNVVATVEDTYLNQDKSYGSIQVTDSKATIRVKAFEETIKYLENIEKGDIVKVIGKIRKDEDGRYINGEIVKKMENPEYAKLRELEIKNNNKEKNKENKSDDLVVQEDVIE